jgi:plasmid stability protein
MSKVELTLPDELKDFLKRRAAEQDRSVASMLRQVVRQWAKQSQSQTERAA